MKSNHSIYHQGELQLQRASGVEAMADKLAKMMVVDYLQEQHRQFYPLLNCLYVASIDEHDKPWASIITGQTGFISSPDETQLKLATTILKGDILTENIKYNSQLGFLGLQHHTRRRNRLAGELTSANESQLLIKVKQAFGNCPKYIQKRQSTYQETASNKIYPPIEFYTKLNAESEALLTHADTFFIASYHPDQSKRAADISHRGGEPGFITIENNKSFSFNDYSGNNMYMTLGNLTTHPYAGLLFINYETGDIWQFQCETKIIETPTSEYNRQLKLHITEIRKLPDALNLSWQMINQ